MIEKPPEIPKYFTKIITNPYIQYFGDLSKLFFCLKMTLTKTATDPGAEAEHVPSGLPNPEADVHHPTGWLYWRLIMYSKKATHFNVLKDLLVALERF